MEATTTRAPDRRLLEWLEEHNVEYDLHHHVPTVTARQTARAEAVEPRTMVKSVVVQAADGGKALLALEASDRVDLAKAAHALGTTDVHLVTEAQLVEMAPGWEPGTWPPVGAMFGLPVLADSALRDEPEVTINAGSHEFAVRLDQAAWAKAANVRYVDLAEGRPDEPVWAR